MFRDRLGGVRGLERNALSRLVARFPDVQAELSRRRASGEYGFYALASQEGVVRRVQEFADSVGQAFEHVVVLGIGGSALGTRVLLEALRPPNWNELSDDQRDFFPKLTVLDNVDPRTVGSVLGRVDPRRALVNVVSKSGVTAETMAQYLVVRDWLEQALGPGAAHRHVVVTTDPERGPLRELAATQGMVALDIPPGVGGRFSVLSPVGLLPAALVGIDIAALVRGAARAVERAEAADLTRNLAALWAGLQWAADRELGAHIHVLMPYADRLRQLTEWFRQLWAESLGKALDRRGERVHVGPTPLGAVGATDQHSQLQLFTEGPYDKTITVVAVERVDEDVAIPAVSGVPEAIAALSGNTLGQLLAAEREATIHALTEAGRMTATLWLPTVDVETVGELLMLCQIATVYAGAWYGVDPLDQPGVERSKRLTYGALGRAGYPAPAPLADDADWV